MIKRDAEETLRILAEGFPAVSVIGPRHTALVTSDRQQARCAQECAVQTILL